MEHVETPFSEHLESIIQALLNTLEAAKEPGLTLQDVVNIVRGDRVTTGKIRTPALWIFPGPDLIEPAGGRTNDHKLEYIIVAITAGKDPEAGLRSANDLAARAYGVLIADRTLSGTVHDLRPVRFEQSYNGDWAAEIYTAAAVLNAVVRRRE